MAKTQHIKKHVDVKAYKRAKPGGAYKKVSVRPYRRSAPPK
jgi:hypothetical protein